MQTKFDKKKIMISFIFIIVQCWGASSFVSRIAEVIAVEAHRAGARS